MVPLAVIQDRRLTLEQTRVLIALYSFRNKTSDIVWPSRDTIASLTGMHPSNISAATTALVTLGWVKKAGDGGLSRAARYTLCDPDETVAEQATYSVAESATKKVAERATSRVKKVADQATVAQQATVADSARGPVADSATPPVADSARGNEQTIEHTNEQTISPTAPPPVLELVSDIAPKSKGEKTTSLSDAAETALQAACRETWASYSCAYAARYGIAPVRNAQVNAKVKAFVQRIGYDEAPGVARFFVERVQERFVVAKCHEVGLLLSGAEGYRTQWATGQAMTATRAQQADKSQANFDAVGEAMALVRARRGAANVE